MHLNDQTAARAAKLRLAIKALEEALRISYKYLHELEESRCGVREEGPQWFMLEPHREAETRSSGISRF